MTQEEKELLLKDLCGRLPHGVIIHCIYANRIEDHETLSYYIQYTEDAFVLKQSDIECLQTGIADIKPYLRQMDSMTEDENREYELIANRCICTSTGFIHIEAQVLIDWLISHHFDYRGLIEKGLALEAPEGMYNTKTE